MEDMKDQGSMMGHRHEACALLVVVSIFLLWDTIRALLVYAWTHESSSHIVLIPALVIFLIFTERGKIFRVVQSSPVLGLTLILSGVALLWQASRKLPFAAGNRYLVTAALGLGLIWVGGFLLCYGNQAARAAVFPLLFLLLMVPLPDSLLEKTIYLLQQGSTEVSYLLFKTVGVPVLRNGFLLSVPGITIEVAKECSGIRSSMALLITCLLAAHLFLKTPWKMLLFVALAVPLAVIKNGIRITTLTLLSLYVDPSFLRGSLHRDGGFVFFLIALAILAPFLLLLQKSEDQHGHLSLGHATPRKSAAPQC